MWCISKGCNARCSFCNVYNEKPRTPSKERALHVVDNMIALHTVMLCITGGEPLLCPVVKDVIDYASSKGMLVQVNTNGSLLTARYHWLKNVNQICVSLDYADERHDESRKIPGLFLRIKEGLESCMKNGIKVVFSSLYRPSQNIDSLVEFSQRMGVPLTFCFPEVGGDLHSSSYDIPSKKELKAKVARVLKLKRNGANIINSDRYLKNVLEYLEKGKHSYKCRAADWMVYLDQDLLVRPCFYKEPVGTIDEVADDPELLFKNDFSGCQRCVDSSWGEVSAILEMLESLRFFEFIKEIKNFFSVTY